MCRDCGILATGYMSQLITSGYDPEVAMRLYRDSVVQHCLKDRAGDTVIADALYLSDLIEEQGRALVTMRDTNPALYVSFVAQHAAAADARRPT